MVVEMNDQAQRFAVVEPVLDQAIPRHAGDAALDPGVPGQALGLRQTKIPHDSEGFRVRPEIRMEESVRAPIFVGIAEGEFVSQRVLFQNPNVWPTPML